MTKSTLTLTRFADANPRKCKDADRLTLGAMTLAAFDGKNTVVMTGELPWRENKRSVSCIPAGTYRLKHETQGRWIQKLYEDHGHKFLLELIGVSNRSQIQIHPGNYAENIKGCIMVGDSAKCHPARPMVTNSFKAYKRFMAEFNRLNALGKAPEFITIIDTPTTPNTKGKTK